MPIMSRRSAGAGEMPRLEIAPVLPTGSWRDPGAYAGLAAYGSRALAWELTRRHADYRAAVRHEPAVMGGDGTDLPAASAAFVARWGLHFR